MQTLINTEAVAIPALPEINQGMDQPLSKAEQRQSGDHSHQKPVNRGMGKQPPLPGQGDITTRTFLNSHAIVLQAEIAKKMAHGQQSEQFRPRARQHP